MVEEFLLGAVAIVGLIIVFVVVISKPRVHSVEPQVWCATASLVFYALFCLYPIFAGGRSMTALGASSGALSSDFQIANIFRLLAIVCGALCLIIPVKPHANMRWTNKLGIKSLYGYAAALTISSLLCPDAKLFIWFIGQAVIIHAVVFCYVINSQATTLILRALMRSTLGLSFLLLFYMPGWVLLPNSARHLNLDRFAGVFPHPNALATFACAAFAVEFIRPRTRFSNVFSALAVAGVVLSQSEGGYVALAFVVLAIFAGRSPTLRGRKPAFVASSLALVVLVVAFGPSLIAADANGQRLATFSGRSAIWAYTMDSFSRNPLLGTGTYFLSDGDRAAGALGENAGSAHNELLQTLGSAGLLGLAFLLALLVVVCRNAWASHQFDSWVRIAILLGLMINSCFEQTLTLGSGVSDLFVICVLPLLLTSSSEAMEFQIHEPNPKVGANSATEARSGALTT
jgi:O-antigen ligase